MISSAEAYMIATTPHLRLIHQAERLIHEAIELGLLRTHIQIVYGCFQRGAYTERESILQEILLVEQHLASKSFGVRTTHFNNEALMVIDI